MYVDNICKYGMGYWREESGNARAQGMYSPVDIQYCMIPKAIKLTPASSHFDSGQVVSSRWIQ